MVMKFIILATRSFLTDHKNNALALIVLLQYVPRLYLIFPLSSQIIKATGMVTKTAWAGAAYNLLSCFSGCIVSSVCRPIYHMLEILLQHDCTQHIMSKDIYKRYNR